MPVRLPHRVTSFPPPQFDARRFCSLLGLSCVLALDIRVGRISPPSRDNRVKTEHGRNLRRSTARYFHFHLPPYLLPTFAGGSLLNGGDWRLGGLKEINERKLPIFLVEIKAGPPYGLRRKICNHSETRWQVEEILAILF